METQVWENQNRSYFTLYTSHQLSLWVKKIGVYRECIVPAHRSECYILLINCEWGHYREISDYIKAKVWDFLVMTKQTRLISYLLHGLFIMDPSLRSIKPAIGQRITLKKNNELYNWGCDTVRWHWSVDVLFDSCQLTIILMSIRMSTIKVNTECIIMLWTPS